jgi:lambda family phage tail tape measure protein
MERQNNIAGTTSGIFGQLQRSIGDIMFGGQQRGRSVFDQQKAEIERNIQLLETDMAGAIMAAFETEDGFTNIQQMNSELAKLYNLTNALKEAQLADLDVSRQWSTGWTEAFTKYVDSATNAAQQAGEMFNAVTSNMNSAIDNFVENGKGSFSDLAKSIIKDLIKIELKAAASKVLGGAGGFFASMFGGFFAEGGNPPINKPSIVGEKGPELFVPRTAGTIIPNGGSAGTSGAGGNTYITNNISAVDAKSVAQLFAENRKTLFGTVEMARKEMSYSR